MKVWIVTVVDTSDTANGKARVLKICNSHDEAKEYVKDDMEFYINDAGDMPIIVDKGKMSIQSKDDNYGCEWNIEEIETNCLGTYYDSIEKLIKRIENDTNVGESDKKYAIKCLRDSMNALWKYTSN